MDADLSDHGGTGEVKQLISFVAGTEEYWLELPCVREVIRMRFIVLACDAQDPIFGRVSAGSGATERTGSEQGKGGGV